MKVMIYVTLIKFLLADFIYQDAGIVLQMKPVKNVMSHYEIPVDYLIIYQHPKTLLLNSSYIGECGFTQKKAKKHFADYERRIDDKWRTILQGADEDVLKVNSRVKRGVVSNLVGSALGSLLAMFSMSHYFQTSSKHYTDSVHRNTVTLNKHTQIFKSLLAEEENHQKLAKSVICDLYREVNYFTLDNYLQHRVGLIENSIILGSENKLPKNTKITRDLFQICLDTQAMRTDHKEKLVRKICHSWSVNQNQAVFKGALNDINGNIQIKFQISVPILDLDHNIHLAYDVKNIGFFHGEQKFQFQTPNEIYRIGNEQALFNLECLNSICRHWDPEINNCLTEIMLNGTTHTCHSIPLKQFCTVTPYRNTYLVSFKGTYRENRATKLVGHAGNHIVKAGQIYCYDNSFLELLPRASSNFSNLVPFSIHRTSILDIRQEKKLSAQTKISEQITELNDLKTNLVLGNSTLLYVNLSFTFLLTVGFAAIAIKIFVLPQNTNVIIPRPKPEILNFDRPTLRNRPKSTLF